MSLIPSGTTIRCASLLILLSCVLLISGHGQAPTATQADKTQVADIHRAPIVDNTQYLGETIKDRSRQVEKNKHTATSEPITELPAGIVRLPEDWDRAGEYDPLPVKDADAVFIGEVTKSSALFSTDHTTIFSTFEVQISKIFFNQVGGALRVGLSATVERYGGRVRYPDGKIEEITIEGSHYPSLGCKYLFFVQQTPRKATWTAANAEGLNILTAFQLKDGRLYALDRADSSSPLPYEKFDGLPLEQILPTVNEKIRQELKRRPLGGALRNPNGAVSTWLWRD